MRPIFPMVDMCRMSIGCWNRSSGIGRFILSMAAFIFLSVLPSAGANAVGEVTKPPENLTSTPVSTEATNKPKNEVELQRLQTEIKKIIDHKKEIDEQIADIKKINAEYISATNDTVNENKEQASRVVDLMIWFLTAFLVILATGTAYGVYEARHLRSIQESVATTKKEIEGIKGEAKKDADSIRNAKLEIDNFLKETNDFINPVKKQLKEHLRTYSELVEQVTPSTPYGIVGVQSPVSEREFFSRLHDVDVVLVVSDQIGLVRDPSDGAKAYARASQHWRSLKDFPRATLRARRAIKLDASNVDGHIQLCRALSYWATEEELGMKPSERLALLQEALTEIDQARQIQGNTDNEVLLHDRAWIYDSLADLDNSKQAFYINESIESYKRALEIDKAKALLEKREPTVYIRYNYLCALVKAEHFSAAIDELRQTVKMKSPKPIWQWVESDPGLKPLLESPEYGNLAKEVLNDARRT